MIGQEAARQVALPISTPLAGARIGLLTAAASRAGGGVFEAVVAQAEMIRALGGVPVVVALADDHAATDRARLGATETILAGVSGPRQVGFAPDLVRRLEAARLDLLHLHGIWMYPSRAGLVWARRTGRPYVVSPHGMLDPWITARGRWKKALARVGYERASWRAAAALHALTPREARDIAAESGRNDALVIANAGPPPGPAPTDLRGPGVVYLGRIHPKKNLAGLVAGWGLATRPPHARLTIAGWGDAADVAEVRDLAARSDGSVAFVGPIYGEAKQRLLDEARFVILPSFSEGLPMVVLEAWAAGAPTIMSEGCNLDAGFAADGFGPDGFGPDGFGSAAALRCDTGAADIARALEAGFALDEAGWLAMAHAAQRLAAGPFGSDTIANRWGEAYAALLAGGAPR